MRKRRTAVILLLVGGLALAGVLWSGLVIPRFSHGGGASAGATHGKGHPLVMDVTVEIENRGWFPERVEAVGRSVPGLHLKSVTYAPGVLAAGERRKISLAYQITDCAAVRRSSLVVPVRVSRWWGSVTVDAADDFDGSQSWEETVLDGYCEDKP
ncbi:hypothetical protein HII36_10460 [Nonomuraea sp. NN258]|uniref:hypothetical protein n=1 Tax=Nonomuraea antri TaxID=2730852 RepID=UPI00156A4F48|nr:hypothetical protein [Nonomuraea antri]NRQ32255.1 hypothetical protein [Nonomuraea antri]